jgi:hypothetical protein
MTLADLGALLNVLIVLLAIYLFLSLLCSTVLEAAAAIIGSRARMLRRQLGKIFGKDGAKEILESPVISSLTASGPNPAYIPSHEFATAVTALLNDGKLNNDTGGPKALRVLMNEVHGDLDAFRTRVAFWYDSAMERLSGRYKRWTQLWMFLFGLTFAATFNIDSFHLVSSLWAGRAELAPVVEALEEWHDQRTREWRAAPAPAPPYRKQVAAVRSRVVPNSHYCRTLSRVRASGRSSSEIGLIS